MNQKYIGIGLIMLVIISAIFYMFSSSNKQSSESEIANIGKSTNNVPSNNSKDWTEYKSAKYGGFSFQYPKDMRFENICTDYYEDTDEFCSFAITKNTDQDFSFVLRINPPGRGGIPITNSTSGSIIIGNSETKYFLGDATDYDENPLGFKHFSVAVPNIKNAGIFASYNTEDDFKLIQEILATFKFY